MSHLSNWISGIGILIFVYLVLFHGESSVNIINAIAGNSVKGIKALQGRN